MLLDNKNLKNDRGRCQCDRYSTKDHDMAQVVKSKIWIRLEPVEERSWSNESRDSKMLQLLLLSVWWNHFRARRSEVEVSLHKQGSIWMRFDLDHVALVVQIESAFVFVPWRCRINFTESAETDRLSDSPASFDQICQDKSFRKWIWQDVSIRRSTRLRVWFDVIALSAGVDKFEGVGDFERNVVVDELTKRRWFWRISNRTELVLAVPRLLGGQRKESFGIVHNRTSRWCRLWRSARNVSLSFTAEDTKNCRSHRAEKRIYLIEAIWELLKPETYLARNEHDWYRLLSLRRLYSYICR